MYGPGLRKLGKEWNMKPADGKLCGVIHGFPVAMSEGVGYKLLVVNLCMLKPGAEREEVDIHGLLQQPAAFYRIEKYEVNGPYLMAQFHDNPGTMGKLREYVDVELPRLREAGFAGAAHCGQCGEALGDQAGQLFVLNHCPLLVHPRCADGLQALEESHRQEQRKAAPEKRSSLLAPVGALLGGVVGSIPWIILYVLGYMASMAAVLIALGAGLGHRLLGGKEGRGRLALVIILTLLLVPAANFAGAVAQLGYGIHTGELQQEWGVPKEAVTVADTLTIVKAVLSDPEGLSGFLRISFQDLGVAYFFAALGLLHVWRKLHQENVPKKLKLTRVV